MGSVKPSVLSSSFVVAPNQLRTIFLAWNFFTCPVHVSKATTPLTSFFSFSMKLSVLCFMKNVTPAFTHCL